MSESIVPDLRHCRGDGDACEVVATRESIVSNLSYRFWDANVSEAVATRKGAT